MQKNNGDSIKLTRMSFSLQTEMKHFNADVQVWPGASRDTVEVETGKVTTVYTRYDFNDFLKGCAFMERKQSVPFKPFISHMSMPLLH